MPDALLSGANVEIIDSFIWDNVEISDSCQVYNGVICEKVKLHKKTKLCRPAGSVGEGKTPPEFILNQEVSIATSCSIQFFSQLNELKIRSYKSSIVGPHLTGALCNNTPIPMVSRNGPFNLGLQCQLYVNDSCFQLYSRYERI